jgi:hypothetical protein
MSLSDSHSDRPACKRCERSGEVARRGSCSRRGRRSTVTRFGGAFYPQPDKRIIEECNHLNPSA